MDITEKSTDAAFEEFMVEVEYTINLHVNTCEDSLINLAKANMHGKLNEYILMYTNLILNDLKETGKITLN